MITLKMVPAVKTPSFAMHATFGTEGASRYFSMAHGTLIDFSKAAYMFHKG